MTLTSTKYSPFTRLLGRTALCFLVIGILGSSLSTASAFGKRSKAWQNKSTKPESVKVRVLSLKKKSTTRTSPTANVASSTSKARPERKRLFSKLRERRAKARAEAAARPAPKPVVSQRASVRATTTTKPAKKPTATSTKKKRGGLLARMFKPMESPKKPATANVASAVTKKRPTGPAAPNANQSAPRYNEVLLSQSRVRGGNVVINIAQQRARLYVGGQVALDTPISTARSGKHTPRGSFGVGQRVRQGKISTIYKVEMPYWMRLGQTAYGMHAGYLPGYPASAGCIRMPYQAAQKMFDATGSGTRVRITGG